jgi:APA family basic amino acid/polyamine antiporter
LLGGTLVVAALYLLINFAFVSAMGMPGVAAAGEAGSALADRLGGPPLRWAMAACIATAMLACVNATVLGGARILRAMSADGAAASWFVHQTPGGIPARALWTQALWSVVLILTGGFDTLLQMVSVAMVVTGSFTVGSLFVLRFRDPAPRPFRATGYPWLPALYLVASVAVVAIMVRGSLTGEMAAVMPLLGVVVAVVAYAAHAARRRAKRRDGT